MRRMSLFLPSSRLGKPGEDAMLIHHRSNRASIDYSLTRQKDRTNAVVEMGVFPVGL